LEGEAPAEPFVRTPGCGSAGASPTRVENKEPEMKRWMICFVLIALTGLVRADAPAKRADLVDATKPAAKLGKDGQPDAKFMQKHEEFLQREKQPATVLFLGDSITAGWAGGGKEVWKRYDPYNAANFGIGGDRTQHVLWRIENGELADIKPKVTVLMIGTNNLKDDEPDKISEAIEMIVKQIREKTGSKVLLLGIFPRGADPNNADTQMFRGKIAKINERIAKMDDGNNIKYLDISKVFLEPDGSISKEIMKDGLHPGAEGYKRWADAMQSTLDELLK
jgi:lysophospholipase L1-like esterase